MFLKFDFRNKKITEKKFYSLLPEIITNSDKCQLKKLFAINNINIKKSDTTQNNVLIKIILL